jgi:hypothetical protein
MPNSPSTINPTGPAVPNGPTHPISPNNPTINGANANPTINGVNGNPSAVNPQNPSGTGTTTNVP